VKLFSKTSRNNPPASDVIRLHEQAASLYAANRSLARPAGDCADSELGLVSGKNTYVLVTYEDDTALGLFPLGKYAGHGSFIYDNGDFDQHGRITLADADRIIAAFTPAALEASR